MIVLGLDASLDRIGWGAVRVNDDDGSISPIGCGVEPVRPEGDPDYFDSRRPECIRAGVARAFRAGWELHAEPFELLSVYLEAPYVGQNPQTAVGLCLAVGSAWQAVDELASYAPAQLLAPDEWKRLANVEATPRDPDNRRRTLKGLALRSHAVWAANLCMREDVAAELLNFRPEKPLVYLRARLAGFDPGGSQDAADAGLIAWAGAVRNADVLAAV